MNSFRGKVSFSGFGENLLNPQFPDIVKPISIFHYHNQTLECNTNGDKLTEEYVIRLYRSGLDLLYINLYDALNRWNTLID